VKEGYVKTYKKFFEKDFPVESKPLVVAVKTGGGSSSATGTVSSTSSPTSSSTSSPTSSSTSSPTSSPTSRSTSSSTSTTVAVSTSTTVAISTPAIVAISTPAIVALSTPAIVAISTPASVAVSNSISKLKYIKVTFKGIIPEDVELVEQIPISYMSKGTLQDYIQTELLTVAHDFDHEEYFELTKEDEKLMEEIHNETMASPP
jgi:hypothetical protein